MTAHKKSTKKPPARRRKSPPRPDPCFDGDGNILASIVKVGRGHPCIHIMPMVMRNGEEINDLIRFLHEARGFILKGTVNDMEAEW